MPTHLNILLEAHYITLLFEKLKHMKEKNKVTHNSSSWRWPLLTFWSKSEAFNCFSTPIHLRTVAHFCNCGSVWTDIAKGMKTEIWKIPHVVFIWSAHCLILFLSIKGMVFQSSHCPRSSVKKFDMFLLEWLMESFPALFHPYWFIGTLTGQQLALLLWRC